MTRIPKKTITDFSAGMQTSERSGVFGGASLIKNFDIYEDGSSLKPVPSWERWNTKTEEDYNIVTLGGADIGSIDKVYGVGSMSLNWWSLGWKHRQKISTADAGALYTVIDLSILPSHFWENVKDDGEDIRIVVVGESNNQNHHLVGFNKDSNIGHVFVPISSQESFYVYYGNSDATYSNSESLLENGFTNMKSFYLGEYTLIDRGSTADIDDNDPITNMPGYIGDALAEGYYATDGAVYSPNSDEQISFLYYWGGTAESGIFYNGSLTVSISISGQISFLYDTDPGSGTVYSVDGAVPQEEWCFITCRYNDYNGNAEILINNEQVGFVDDNNYDLENDPSTLYFQPGTNSRIQYMQTSRVRDSSIHYKTYDMWFNNSSYWSILGQDSIESVTIEWGGTRIYEKNIGDDLWKESLYLGSPIQSSDVIPIPSFIYGKYPITTLVTTGDKVGDLIYYLANVGHPDGDWTDEYLTGVTQNALPRIAHGVDRNYYFYTLQNINSLSGSTLTEDLFSPYTNMAGLTAYGQYMALLSNRIGRSYAQIWDLDSTQANEFIEVGDGDGRVILNVKGQLFAVVNRTIDDSINGNGTNSLDIRSWQGGQHMDNFFSLETSSNVDGYYNNNWESPILNQVEYIQNAGLFYARIPDRDGNIQEGLWAIGKSETSNQFGVSIYKSTDDLGDVSFMYRSGGNIIVIHGDGKISKISHNTYNDLSEWVSPLYIGSGRVNEDKIDSVEVAFEPLDGTQTISLYYRKKGEVDFTLIGSTSEKDKNVLEFKRTQDNKQLPSFHEIEFKVTSTGGKSKITQLTFYQQQTNDNS